MIHLDLQHGKVWQAFDFCRTKVLLLQLWLTWIKYDEILNEYNLIQLNRPRLIKGISYIAPLPMSPNITVRCVISCEDSADLLGLRGLP